MYMQVMVQADYKEQEMEEMGIIQKEGVGRNTRYIKTASFPSFN